MNTVRVGWLSDWYALGTGFGTVARNVLARLATFGGCDVRQLAIGFHPVKAVASMPDGSEKLEWMNQITGSTHTWDLDFPYPGGIPAYEVFGDDPWGQDCLGEWIERFQPDVMVVNADLWMTAWLVQSAAYQNSLGPQFIYYQPIDGIVADGTLPHHFFKGPDGTRHKVNWEELMWRQHWTVLYGEWAREAYMRSLPEQYREDAFNRSRVIKHGVDLKVFHPYPKMFARKQFGFPDDLAENAFVVGMVATNQSRKDWPGIARAMGEFMRRHDNVYFFPWTKFFPAEMDGWDLERLFALHMPINRIIRNGDLDNDFVMSHDVVNKFYAALDVHVLMHHGEGCGLPHLEAQAAGTPALAVNYAGIVDYFSQPWLKIRPKFNTTGVRNCIERPDGDQKQLVQKLEALYADPELRLRIGRKSVPYARAHWDWDDLAEQWVEIVMTAAEAKHRRDRECAENASRVGESSTEVPGGESSSATTARRIVTYPEEALDQLPAAAGKLDALRQGMLPGGPTND